MQSFDQVIGGVRKLALTLGESPEQSTEVRLHRSERSREDDVSAARSAAPHSNQGYFLCRGLAKVRGEFSLATLAYNLQRVINLLGVPRLLEAVA